MRRLERIPLHDHSDNNSGGLVAASTSVTIDVSTGGGSSAEVTFGSPAATAAALADGSNSTAARSDHVHTNAYLGTVLAYGTAAAGYLLTASSAGSATWAAAGADVTLSTVAASGATETIDVSTARTHDVTLTADCTFTFSGATTAEAWFFTLVLRQDGTGGWTTTWPGSVVWPGGVAPTLDETASTVEVLTFFTLDGGTTWYGFHADGGEPTADAHIADTADAHDASAVSIADAGGYYTGTDVEAALQEIGAGGIGGGAGHYEILMASGSADPLLTSDGLDYLYVWVT